MAQCIDLQYDEAATRRIAPLVAKQRILEAIVPTQQRANRRFRDGVLPLVPSYVTFLTGLSLEDVSRARRVALVHSLLFVCGFTAIFVALGAGATALGVVLAAYRDWIGRTGGALLVIFGLILLEIIRVPALSHDRRIYLADKPVGYLGSVLAGLAVPFLLAALAIDQFLALFARLRRGLVRGSRVAGVLLIVVGVLLASSWFTMLATGLQRLTPIALRGRL